MLILYKESCEKMYLIESKGDTVHEKANIKIVCQDIFDMLDYLFVYESLVNKQHLYYIVNTR